MTISQFFTRFFKRSYYAGGDKCDASDRIQNAIDQFKGASVTTPDRAMTIASVYRCVDILSGTIASLELQHLKRSGSIFQYAGNTQLNTLFAGQANSRQNFFVLLKNVVARLLLSGNAYIYPRYSTRGELLDIILLGDGAVSYDKHSNTYSVSDYVWNINGVFAADEIIHLKNNSLDGGYTGVSTITYASISMSLSANADKQTNDGLLSGNQKSGFLVGGNELQGIGALDSDVADKVVDRVNNEIAQGRRIVRKPSSRQGT